MRRAEAEVRMQYGYIPQSLTCPSLDSIPFCSSVAWPSPLENAYKLLNSLVTTDVYKFRASPLDDGQPSAMDDSKSRITLEPPAPELKSLTRSEAAKNRSRDVCTACHEAHVRVRLCPPPFQLCCGMLTLKYMAHLPVHAHAGVLKMRTMLCRRTYVYSKSLE